MLQIVSIATELGRYQKLLEGLLCKGLPRMLPFAVGRPGKTYDLFVHTDGDLWFGARLAPDDEPNRYWNSFGLMSAEHPSNIVVETNIPLSGVVPGIAGLFARDPQCGDVYLLHRGKLKIAGARKGIGKKEFFRWCTTTGGPRRLVQVAHPGSSPTQVILVARLAKDDLVKGLYRFVHDVRDFKAWARGTETAFPAGLAKQSDA